MGETYHVGKNAAERRAVTELHIGVLKIDSNHFTVHVDGHPVPLTRLEFDLLRYLVTNSDRVVGIVELMDCIVGGVHEPGSSLLRPRRNSYTQPACGVLIPPVKSRPVCIIW